MADFKDLYLQGHALYEKGAFKQADNIMQEALKSALDIYDEEHISVGITKSYLARIQFAMNNLEEAKHLCEQAIPIYEYHYFDQPTKLLSIYMLMVEIQENRIHFKQAIQFLDKIIEIEENRIDTENSNLHHAINKLGIMYKKQGQYKTAENALNRSFEISKDLFGEDSFDTAVIANNLAQVCIELRNFRKASKLLEKAKSVYIKKLGINDPAYAIVLGDISKILLEEGKYYMSVKEYEKAESVFEEAKNNCTQAYRINISRNGPNSFETSTYLGMLGQVFKYFGYLWKNQNQKEQADASFKKAIKSYESSLEIRLNILPKDYPDIGICFKNLAELSFVTGELNNSQENYSKALVIFEKKLGLEHPETAETLEDYSKLLKMLLCDKTDKNFDNSLLQNLDGFEKLVEYAKSGDLIIFCGAGISIPSPTSLPGYQDFTNAILDFLLNKLPDDQRKKLLSLPGWQKEEAEDILPYWLKHLDLPAEVILQKIYNYWGRKAIDFTDIFDEKNIKLSNENHRMIAELAKQYRLLPILTTNFDKLIDNELGPDAIILTDPQSINNYANSGCFTGNVPDLIKLHGDAGNHSSIILTLNQVGKAQPKIKDAMSTLMKDKALLFLGYGGRDFDIMGILEDLHEKNFIKDIFWTFHLPAYYNDIKMERSLQAQFSNLHSIVYDTTELLSLLCQKTGLSIASTISQNIKETDNDWKKSFDKICYSLDLTEFDEHKIFLIFAEYAAETNDWHTQELFLDMVWDLNQNRNLSYQDSWILGKVAHFYHGLMKIKGSQFLLNKEAFHEKYKSHIHRICFGLKHVYSTNDPILLVKTNILAAQDELEEPRSIQNALNFLEKATDYLNQIKGEIDASKVNMVSPDGYNDSLIQLYKGQIEAEKAYCYIELIKENLYRNVNQDNIYRHHFNRKHQDLCEEALQKAEKIFFEIGAIDELADILFRQGQYWDLFGEFEGAIEKYQDAHVYHVKLKDRVGQAHSLREMGITYGHNKQNDKKLECLNNAKALFDSVGNAEFAINCLSLMKE